MSYSLAIDIGGTFTDAVLRGSDGSLTVDKTLTTHHDLLEGFFRGVDLVLAKAGVGPEAVDGVVVHATTVVTNALIERKGQPTALIITKGFRDVLSIRNEHRYEMYDPQIEFAEPLIPRALTFEVDERVLADGEVLRGVDVAEVEALVAELQGQGVVSVAICLINAFRNGGQRTGHRRGAARQGRRTSTCRCRPTSRRRSANIRAPRPRRSTPTPRRSPSPICAAWPRGLEKAEVANQPLIMLSSGGVIGAEVAGRNPVRMIESGPAAGALAAAFYAERLGLERLLSFDMGGTTAKACLIEDRKPLVTGSFEVDRMYRFCEGSGMPLTIPSIDMIEIGAGGGSIASVNDLGLLKVGPQSAGSAAGPGLLRPRRPEPDRHRRRPGAGPPRRRQLPRRRHAARQSRRPTRRWTGLAANARRRAARRPPAASTASWPRPWPARRAPTPPTAASTTAACRCWPSAAPGRCTPAPSASCCRARR